MVQVYSGFLMANNCGLIAQNGLTGDYNQVSSLSSTIEAPLTVVSHCSSALAVTAAGLRFIAAVEGTWLF